MKLDVIVTGVSSSDLTTNLIGFCHKEGIALHKSKTIRGFYRMFDTVPDTDGDFVRIEYWLRILGKKVFIEGYVSDFMKYLASDKDGLGERIPCVSYSGIEVEDIKAHALQLNDEFFNAEVNCF